jgi:hypothetical protein
LGTARAGLPWLDFVSGIIGAAAGLVVLGQPAGYALLGLRELVLDGALIVAPVRGLGVVITVVGTFTSGLVPSFDARRAHRRSASSPSSQA